MDHSVHAKDLYMAAGCFVGGYHYYLFLTTSINSLLLLPLHHD